jgi:UDP:flavonoid glycosyltransferase YjiC (YdhE family)
VLLIPITLEQYLLARRVVDLGAGLLAHPRQGDQIVAGLRDMIETEDYGRAARRFAERYCDYDPRQNLYAAVDRLDQLARSVSCS